MSAQRTLKQRMVLRRKPRAFAIGTIRQWQGGQFVKVGPNAWRRQAVRIIPALPKGAANERGGLGALARTLDGEGRKRAVAAVAQHVVNQMSTWDVRNPPILLPLPSALAAIMTAGGDHWTLFCARRTAEFNDGMVDLGSLDKYVERFKRKMGGPEASMAKSDYMGPRSVADINLASWMAYFAEGGQLNQPSWLETNRFKDLRHQFELLANMHGGRR